MEDRQKKILEQMKVDIAPTLNRFVDSEEFYFEMLDKLSGDGTFESLVGHIMSKNYEEAFKDAHTLKGVSANLGLGLLNDAIVPLTEELRHAPYDDSRINQYFVMTQENYNQCIENIAELS